jgi:hypothetical protein
MPLLTRTEGFYRGFGSPSAFLAAPTMLSSRRLNSAGTSINSDTINPGDGSLNIIIPFHRITSATDVAHTAPTTTLSNMSARTEIVTRGEVGFAAIKVGSWWSRATGATGDGVLTANYDASVSNRMVGVIRFASGFDTTTPIGLSASNRANSGTSLGVSFGSAPAATSIGILCLIDSLNGTTGDNPADWNYLNDPDGNPVNATSVGTLHARTLWRRNPGIGPHTFTGLSSGLIRAVILIEVLQA